MGSGNLINELKKAAKSFSKNVISNTSNTRITIITFSSRGEEIINSSRNLNDIDSAIDSVVSGGGTMPSEALDIIKNEVDKRGNINDVVFLQMVFQVVKMKGLL